MSLPPPSPKFARRTRRKMISADGGEALQTVRRIGDQIVRIDTPARTEPSSPAVDLDVAIAELIEAGFLPKAKVTSSRELTASDASPRDWLAYHASDLIDRLTEWSDDLGVREANLNARQAMWERQARRLRLQFQQAQVEIDEIETRLKQTEARVAEQEQQLQLTARQFAIATR